MTKMDKQKMMNEIDYEITLSKKKREVREQSFKITMQMFREDFDEMDIYCQGSCCRFKTKWREVLDFIEKEYPLWSGHEVNTWYSSEEQDALIKK